jgi:hypothetical protein
MIGLLDHGVGQAFATDMDDGIEMVCRGAMFLALRGGQNESSHLRIIRRA